MKDWFKKMLKESQFMKQYALFSDILPNVFPIESENVEVMAIGRDSLSEKYILKINKSAIEKNEEYRTCFCGLLLHEILHVSLGHCDMRLQGLNLSAWMLAAELTVNELIKEPLPRDGLFLEEYQKIVTELKKFQSTRERYEIIANSFDEKPLLSTPVLLRKLEEINRIDKSESAIEESNQSLMEIIHEIHAQKEENADAQEKNEQCDKHKKINTSNILCSKVEEREVNPASRANRAFSEKLRRYLLSKINRKDFRYSLKKPNRRFPELIGVVPGKKHVVCRSDLLVGIDTSGSMTAYEFGLIERELAWIKKLVKNITIVECDSAIRRSYKFEGKLSSVFGGGDTNLEDIFTFKNENHLNERIILVFTDGHIQKIENNYNYETIWVLTKRDGIHALNAACSFGKRIILADALEE